MSSLEYWICVFIVGLVICEVLTTRDIVRINKRLDKIERKMYAICEDK